MNRKLSLLAALAVAAGLTGCSQSDDSSTSMSTNQPAPGFGNDVSNAWQKTKETSTNAWESIKSSMHSASDYSYDHKDQYLADARADMDALDQKIQKWSDKAANATDSAKADAQAKLQDLRAQRSTLDQKYQAVKDSSSEDWDKVKAGFQDSYDATTNSLHQAWQWLSDKVSS